MDERRATTDPEVPADQPDDAPGEEPRRLGLAELAEAAGVSVRTVRYYIAEGLLPPPEGAGPRSAYTTGHLDRLRLIGRLKDAYLPLREIRRRLDGLDDAAVRALLARLGPPPGAPAAPEPMSRARARAAAEAPPDSAAEYLARVMRPRPAARQRLDPRAAAPPAPGLPVGDRPLGAEQTSRENEPFTASAHWRAAPDRPGAEEAPGGPPSAPAPGPTAPSGFDLDPALALVSPGPEPEPAGEEAAWRRIRLGPDAELLVREDAYHRRRDRVDWLVRWARKVFG